MTCPRDGSVTRRTPLPRRRGTGEKAGPEGDGAAVRGQELAPETAAVHEHPPAGDAEVGALGPAQALLPADRPDRTTGRPAGRDDPAQIEDLRRVRRRLPKQRRYAGSPAGRRRWTHARLEGPRHRVRHRAARNTADLLPAPNRSVRRARHRAL